MYRRPKFLEILLEIRREMAHEADYDVDLFAENARSGIHSSVNVKSSSMMDAANARSDSRAEEAELTKTSSQIHNK